MKEDGVLTGGSTTTGACSSKTSILGGLALAAASNAYM
jgi:hypothetical protein